MHDGNPNLPTKFETCCYDKILECSDAPPNGGLRLRERSSALLRDAELVDRPCEAKTFWVDTRACPTTSLEKIVKTIFDFHAEKLGHRSSNLRPPRVSPDTAPTSSPASSTATGENKDSEGNGRDPRDKGAIPNAASNLSDGCAASGAEWWVQRRQESHHDDLGMPFHWDKDEEMLEQKGLVVCPAVSTVTYLTDEGAPTVVLESRATSRGMVDAGDIERAFVSYPARFKHLAFDGGFLHGVPEQLIRMGRLHEREQGNASGRPKERSDDDSTTSHASAAPTSSLCATALCSERWRRRRRGLGGGLRVTLLVNIWVGHKPKGVAPLPPNIAASLSVEDSSAACTPPRFDRRVPFAPVSISREHGAALQPCCEAGVPVAGGTRGSTTMLRAPLGPALLLELLAPSSTCLSKGNWRAPHSFMFMYGEGSLPRIRALDTLRATDISTAAPLAGSVTRSGESEDDGSGTTDSSLGKRRPAESSTDAQGKEKKKADTTEKEA